MGNGTKDKVCPILSPIDKMIQRPKMGVLKPGEPPVDIGVSREFMVCLGPQCLLWDEGNELCTFIMIGQDVRSVMLDVSALRDRA